MMNRLKKIVTGLLAFGFVAGFLWLFFKLLVFFYHAFASLDSNVAIAIVAGSATILTSTLTIVGSRYYQVKREQEIAHRDKKIELYDRFLRRLFEIFLDSKDKERDPENLVPFFREIQRELILWSSADAITAYTEWHKVLSTTPPRALHMIKLMDFFLALRKDLGHTNRGIDHSHLVRFLLRSPDLFLQEYQKNSDITLDEIAKIEKQLGLVTDAKE